jgi:uncharacterized damage-inducible protein DinB
MNYYTAMASYNQWMNQNLYTLCADLADGERKLDRGAFFKSIHGTLNHILIADLIWLGRFTQQPFVAKLDQELYSDFTELRTQREQIDVQIIDWAHNLAPDWLNQDFNYTNSSGFTRTRPRWLLVTHMFNHQTHHRGQITTLLAQMGCKLEVTDLPAMPQPTLDALA